MQQGVRYKGYATINEYGEIMFEPEQKGAHEGRIKEVCRDDELSVKTTERLIICNLKIEKGQSTLANIAKLCKIIDKLLTIFRTYEF